MRIIIGLILSVFLFSCNILNKQEDNIESVSLSRSGCYGKCPVYTVTLFRDGSVKYTGKMFVDFIGNYTLNRKVDFSQLENLVNEADFFNLDNKYMSRITDSPSCGVSVKTNKLSKSVLENGEGPIKLKMIQGYIDTFIKETPKENWIKVE